jgi:hypothetical protein
MSDATAAIPLDSEAAPQRFCPDCGYDLRGLTSDRCPECGLKIDDAAMAASPIPWVHRQRIGRARAFWRTLLVTTFRPRRLASAAAMPVDYRQAQRFRRWIIVLTSLPFVAAILVARRFGATDAIGGIIDVYTYPNGYPGGVTPRYGWMDPAFCWSAGAMLWPVLAIGVLITFALITAAPSYWFHPSSLPIVRQNRAVAISAYLCGPLLWIALLVTAAGVVMALMWAKDIDQSSLMWTLGLLLALLSLATLAVILLLAWNTMRVFSRTTRPSMGRFITAGLVIPVCAVLSIVVGLGVFPGIVGFIWLMIDSVR